MVDQAMIVAKQFGADVINAVKVNSPQQVMLEVRFVEASRSASRELGVNWQVLGTTLAAGGTGVGAAVGASSLVSGAIVRSAPSSAACSGAACRPTACCRRSKSAA